MPHADPRPHGPELTEATGILSARVAEGLLPSAAFEVGDHTGPRGRLAVGAPDDAVYDLASLTKVLATGVLAAHLLGARRLDLDRRVARLVPDWKSADRADVTLRDLLAHASGLPAHAPLFHTVTGVDGMVRAIARLPLEVAPRTRAIYSDLGFIVLGRVLETVAERPLASIVAELLGRVSADPPGYGVSPGRLVQPTGHSAWRARWLCGEVHDDNAAAMGGAAGHAGLFGSVRGVGDVARVVLQALIQGHDNDLAPAWAFRAFSRRSPVPGSSRALAWDTALPTSSCGTRLSSRAIGHTGFTGTSVWIDPERDLYVVLLTNRVAGTASPADIAGIRRQVHEAIAAVWSPRRG